MRLLFILLLLIPIVSASPSAITIVTMEDDDGDVSIKEIYQGIGYSPSHANQKGEYDLKVYSSKGQLYGLAFSPPVEYVDGHLGEENIGGIREVDEFSVTIPSFPNEERIEVSRGREVMAKHEFVASSNFLLYFLFIVFLVIILVVRKIMISRREPVIPS